MIISKFLPLAAIAMAAVFVPSAHAEILIAVASPMTGQYVWTGEKQHQGVRLAASPSVENPVFDSRLSGILQEALEKAARLQKADNISASLYLSDQCYWEGVWPCGGGIPHSTNFIVSEMTLTSLLALPPASTTSAIFNAAISPTRKPA